MLILLLHGGSLPVHADELSSVFDQLLSNPGDPALNIRYAELVEARGDTRKALAAYERALAQHPDNRDLLRGYRRIKRKLKPKVTSLILETGVRWESNPLQLPDTDARKESDITFDFNLLLFDERTIAGHRLRSVGHVRTEYQGDVNDISDLALSFASGPVFEVGKKSRLHIAPGGTTAWLDGDWLYYDALLKVTFETVRRGATQAITAQIAHRTTNDKFLGQDGVIFDLKGRFAFHNKLMQGDALYVLPKFRFSEPGGSGPGFVFKSPLLPGNYLEYGNRAVYYRPVAHGRAFIGAGLGAFHRTYNQNVAFGTKDREDVLLEPTAHLVIPRVRGTKFDLRFDYRFEHNDSNDDLEDYDNHVVSAKTVRRF